MTLKIYLTIKIVNRVSTRNLLKKQTKRQLGTISVQFLKLSLNKTLLTENHFPTLRLVPSKKYPNGKYMFKINKKDTRAISMDIGH